MKCKTTPGFDFLTGVSLASEQQHTYVLNYQLRLERGSCGTTVYKERLITGQCLQIAYDDDEVLQCLQKTATYRKGTPPSIGLPSFPNSPWCKSLKGGAVYGHIM